MGGSRKQISFDLDTKALQKYYPGSNWRKAYADIKAFMKNKDFSWQEGSVYVSQKPIVFNDVEAVLDQLFSVYPRANLCMRDCQYTDIGRKHDGCRLKKEKGYIIKQVVHERKKALLKERRMARGR